MQSQRIKPKMLLWYVQPFEILHGSLLQPDAVKFDCFKSTEPMDIDVLDFLGDPVDWRAAVKRWPPVTC